MFLAGTKELIRGGKAGFRTMSVSVHRAIYTIYTSPANTPMGCFHGCNHSAVTFQGTGIAQAGQSCWQQFLVAGAPRAERKGIKNLLLSPRAGLAAPGNSPIRDHATALLVVEDCSSGLFLKK